MCPLRGRLPSSNLSSTTHQGPGPSSRCLRVPICKTEITVRPALQGCGGEVIKQHTWNVLSPGALGSARVLTDAGQRSPHSAIPRPSPCLRTLDSRQPKDLPSFQEDTAGWEVTRLRDRPAWARFSDKFQSHTQPLPCTHARTRTYTHARTPAPYCRLCWMAPLQSAELTPKRHAAL